MKKKLYFPDNPDIDSNIIYIGYAKKGFKSKPIYVGESSRYMGRVFGDYISMQFSAETDFKIGYAIRCLQEKSFKIYFKWMISSKIKEDRLKEEATKTKELEDKGYVLLNKLKGYDYRIADENEVKTRIREFVRRIVSQWVEYERGYYNER